MIRREDALKAFAEDEFDLVVIGGGITGAGVALDAATRGYSVALVEREDFASGTSSRSSKLVHGGLRYLQNFDLGLVREALLERSILVKLAPHLVRPLPLLVSSFENKRPDRMLGMGLNMYDRMARELKRPGKRGRDPFMDEEDWSPEKHRIIEGDEVRELLPALAPREPTAAYLFYDCQTDDARLVLTVLGEAERFGAVCANRCRVDELLIGRRPRLRSAVHGHRRRRRVRDPRDERGQRDRRVGGPDPARGDARRGRHPSHPPEPRHPHHLRAGGPPAERGRDRAGGRRAQHLRPALARAHADRHHRQRLRGSARARPAGRDRHRVPARRGQQVLRDIARARATSRARTRACGR